MSELQICKSCGKEWVDHQGIQMTCAENIKLKQRITHLEKSLFEIKNQDYRGYRSIESQIAERALETNPCPSK